MKTQLNEQSTGTAKNEKTNKPDYFDDPKQLLQKIPIEDTPFQATKAPLNEQSGKPVWFLTMGKYRLTQPLETLEEVLEACKDVSWNRILSVIQILILEHEAAKKEQTNTMPNTEEKK